MNWGDGIWRLSPPNRVDPAHLIEPLRIMLGMMEWTTATEEEIREEVGLAKKKYITWRNKVFRSDDFIVQGVLNVGLPITGSVHLRKPYRCVKCRELIRVVPCISCCQGIVTIQEIENEPEPTLLEPKPTKARPGTHEKIEVLRERVALKQGLWHSDDVRGCFRCGE